MGRVMIAVLRVVIVLSLAGALLVQTVIVPLLWADLAGEAPWGRVALVTIVVLFVLTLEVGAVCIWRLLTMVRRGSVFSAAAFRYVDVIIGAVAAAAVIVFALAVVLAPGPIAPGVVGLICGAALVIAGVALLVVVMRMLLAQAIDREAEARRLKTELSRVV
jgi:hypothetical protein